MNPNFAEAWVGLGNDTYCEMVEAGIIRTGRSTEHQPLSHVGSKVGLVYGGSLDCSRKVPLRVESMIMHSCGSQKRKRGADTLLTRLSNDCLAFAQGLAHESYLSADM